jgi:hypothetical protein
MTKAKFVQTLGVHLMKGMGGAAMMKPAVAFAAKYKNEDELVALGMEHEFTVDGDTVTFAAE